MNIEIRRASAADAKTLIVLNREVQAKHVDAFPWLFKNQDMSEDAARALLRGENNSIFLGFAANEPAGYIYAEYRTLSESASRHQLRTVHIHHISVQSEYKRRGVGRALMHKIMDEASERRVARLTTDFWAFNDESRGFFENFGFSPYNIRMWREV